MLLPVVQKNPETFKDLFWEAKIGWYANSDFDYVQYIFCTLNLDISFERFIY